MIDMHSFINGHASLWFILSKITHYDSFELSYTSLTIFNSNVMYTCIIKNSKILKIRFIRIFTVHKSCTVLVFHIYTYHSIFLVLQESYLLFVMFHFRPVFWWWRPCLVSIFSLYLMRHSMNNKFNAKVEITNFFFIFFHCHLPRRSFI